MIDFFISYNKPTRPGPSGSPRSWKPSDGPSSSKPGTFVPAPISFWKRPISPVGRSASGWLMRMTATDPVAGLNLFSSGR